MPGKILICCLLCCIGYLPEFSLAELVSYTDEAAFRAALDDKSPQSWQILHEGFENSAWQAARSPAQQKVVFSQGLTWSANHQVNALTTGRGAAHSGSWALFSNPHGDSSLSDPAAFTRDGLLLRSESRIHAIGGWFNNNLARGKIGFVLDGARTVTFDGKTLGVRHGFYGLIDDDGFLRVEIHEREGTVEDRQFLFADDLLIGREPGSG